MPKGDRQELLERESNNRLMQSGSFFFPSIQILENGMLGILTLTDPIIIDITLFAFLSQDPCRESSDCSMQLRNISLYHTCGILNDTVN